MKTEYALIAAVVIIGVLFSVNSLLGMKTSETSTTAASSSSLTTTSTSGPTSSTSTALTTSSTTPETSITQVSTFSSTSTTTSTTRYMTAIDPDIEFAVSTDKATYYSGNILNLSVSIESLQPMPGAQLKVYGIMAGYYRIDSMEKIDVVAGENNFIFPYKTPRCYSCGGIRPGRYNVSAELIYYGKVIAKSTARIEMKQ